jgi:hypothetical protein
MAESGGDALLVKDVTGGDDLLLDSIEIHEPSSRCSQRHTSLRQPRNNVYPQPAAFREKNGSAKPFT